MATIELPSMKREERSTVYSAIKRGFTFTFKEIKKETGFTKEEVLNKLDELGYLVTWEKNPSYKFAAKDQPIPYSVYTFVYTAGGSKSYGRQTLWLFKPFIVDILLGKAVKSSDILKEDLESIYLFKSVDKYSDESFLKGMQTELSVYTKTKLPNRAFDATKPDNYVKGQQFMHDLLTQLTLI